MDGQGAPVDDPFEAFRKRKKVEAEEAEKLAQIAEKAKQVQPPREDGRPQGFVTHRHDFDKVDETPPEEKTEPRPKGFVPTQLSSELTPIEPPPRPKGFSTHHLKKKS